MFYVGTAGWNLPTQVKNLFPQEGTHLQRYAQVLTAVEINSAFYRDHKPETYIKWATMTPDHFRFAVKLSRHFIHDQRLKETGPYLKEVVDGIKGLDKKLGALLVQLPPSLEFDSSTTEKFLIALKSSYDGVIVWEPRHMTWKSNKAVDMLAAYDVSKVLADPEPCRLKKEQRIKVEKVRYLRLHGTPEIYKSRYSETILSRIAERIEHPISPAEQTWCIFDNTTFGFATENALELKNLLDRREHGNAGIAPRSLDRSPPPSCC